MMPTELTECMWSHARPNFLALLILCVYLSMAGSMQGPPSR